MRLIIKQTTGLSLGKKLNELLLGYKNIDDDLLEEVESQLCWLILVLKLPKISFLKLLQQFLEMLYQKVKKYMNN